MKICASPIPRAHDVSDQPVERALDDAVRAFADGVGAQRSLHRVAQHGAGLEDQRSAPPDV